MTGKKKTDGNMVPLYVRVRKDQHSYVKKKAKKEKKGEGELYREVIDEHITRVKKKKNG